MTDRFAHEFRSRQIKGILKAVLILMGLLGLLVLVHFDMKRIDERVGENQRLYEMYENKYKLDVKNGLRYDYPRTFGLRHDGCYTRLALRVAYALSKDDWQNALNKELEEVEKWYKECEESFEVSVNRLKNPNALSGRDNEDLEADRWRLEGAGRVLHEYRKLYRDLLKAPEGTFPTNVSHFVSPDGYTYLGRIGQRLFNIDALRHRYQSFDGDEF